jgi:8-oxo-dGTP pyrophosphatase MutT (NUDIX family)
MSKPIRIVGASVIIHKDGKILLQQRWDDQCWAYHGGQVDLGEFVEDAAKRELKEETGLTAEELHFFGVFSGPELFHIYPDGQEAFIIDILYTCKKFSGEITRQIDEVLDLQWFDIDNLPSNLTPHTKPALMKFVAEYTKNK